MGTAIETALFLIVFIILTCYLYLIWKFNYWKSRGVSGPQPKPLLGTLPSSLNKKQNVVYDIDDIYKKYKKTENFVGVFTIREPELLIVSPKLIHEVLVTKFKNFHENSISQWVNRSIDKIIALNPFILAGDEWKEKRSELMPALTTNRMKASFPIMQQGCDKLKNFIKENIKKNDGLLEAKNLCSRLTAEVVSDCIYGLKAGAFDEDNNVMHQYATNMSTEFTNGFQTQLTANVIPLLGKALRIRFLSKKTEKFFVDILHKAIEIRGKSEPDRSDLLNFMLQLQQKKNITHSEMVAHTLTFYLDGFETTATVISHCLLLLARNERAQKILREEINKNATENGEIDHDKLLELKYLDHCLNESMRIFPPIIMSSRICTVPIELENFNGEKLLISKGTSVQIPYFSLHHDEDIYPNPEDFLPERFDVNDAKTLRDEGKFLPFGDGPRICLGMKFGITLSKLAIFEVIRNFELKIHDKTRKDNLLDLRGPMSMLEGGIWINFKQI